MLILGSRTASAAVGSGPLIEGLILHLREGLGRVHIARPSGTTLEGPQRSAARENSMEEKAAR
jgi:hypothetical protein